MSLSFLRTLLSGGYQPMVRRFALAFACLALVCALPAHAAEKAKKSPACAAVSFRPLSGNLGEGDNPAGYYSSRFGSIELLGTVKGGQPTGYHIRVDRKELTPLGGDIPKSAYACLKSKHIKTPPEPAQGGCLGSRFRVAIDRSGGEKLYMLFALQGDDWKLCQTGLPPH
jgi:hypothetical protein